MASSDTGSVYIQGMLKQQGWRKVNLRESSDFSQQTGHVLPEGEREGSGPGHRGGCCQDVPEHHVTDVGL